MRMPVTDLGSHVLEIGPGPGLTTDLLVEHMDCLTAVELDSELARALADRYDDSDPRRGGGGRCDGDDVR